MATIGTMEAAQRLGITRRRVLALIKNEQLKATRSGGVWLIDERSLASIKRGKPGRPRMKK